ncbi:MAG: response regulator transcription factor [Actinobacteria bacterium]|nr:response regulator transcription factor [Actinomycetota bacterium]
MTDTTTRGMRVLLVEDEALSRSLIAGLLESGGYVVAAYGNAKDASRSFEAFCPDAIVTDIDLHTGPSGIDLVVAVKKRHPGLKVVILSNYAIAPDLRHSSLADAAYLNKRDLTEPDVLLATLKSLLSNELCGAMDSRIASGPLAPLTAAQAEVLRMVASGLTNEEIAARRFTTVKSVENMVHRIMATLGVSPDHSLNRRVVASQFFTREAGSVEPPHTLD